MADSKTIGVQSWEGIRDSLTELRDEMLKFENDARVAEVIKSLNEKIKIAAMNAGKNQNGWFWGTLLGLNSEADRTVINAAQATYQTLMNGISEITNTMITQNNAKRQAEIKAIEEVAQREKWSAEETAAAKEQINRKYDAKERKLKEVQRNMSIVQATVNTAVAVTKALEMGPVLGPIFAGIIGAMGAVQISLIKAQKFARGGRLNGIGGPKEDKNLAWFSPGEYLVNAEATSKWGALLDAINSGSLDGVSRSVSTPSGSRYAEGGRINDNGQMGSIVENALQKHLSSIKVIIDARNPDAKSWAKTIKVGERELAGLTIG
jgi:hypothetical protein